MANLANLYPNLKNLFNDYIEGTIESFVSDRIDDILNTFTNYNDIDYIEDNYSFSNFTDEFDDGLSEYYIEVMDIIINSDNYNFYEETEEDIYGIDAIELSLCIVHFNRQIINNEEEELYNHLLNEATDSSSLWNNLCYMYVKLFDDNDNYYMNYFKSRVYRFYYEYLVLNYDSVVRKLECPICREMKGGYTGCCSPNCKTILCKECYNELKVNKCPYCRTEPMVNEGITKAIIRNTSDSYMKMYNNVMVELLVVEFGL